MTDDASGEVPAWLVTSWHVAVTAVFAFGLVGLVSAVAGWFRPALVLPVAGLAWLALAIVTRPRHITPPTRAAERAAIVAVALIAANGVVGALHRSEHVTINRDPGIYVNAAVWLAREGTLEVDAAVGPFAGTEGVEFETAGMYTADDGDLQFQGAHLLPAVMAAGKWIGGDAVLFMTPVLLASLALLSVYVLVAQRAGAWPALFAVALVIGFAPFISFSRDAYTEVLALTLVCAAIVPLPRDGRPPSSRAAIVVGLALGLVCALRIDGVATLLLWPWIVMGWTAGPNGTPAGEPRAARRAVGWIAGLAGLGALIGYVDLAMRSPQYLEDLWARTTALWIAFAASTALAVLVGRVAVVGRAWRTIVRNLRRPGVARGTAIAFIVLLAGLWIARPVLETVRGEPRAAIGDIQEASDVRVDPTLRYAEHSLEWQSWYLGPVALAAGIVGLGVAVHAIARGRGRRFGALLATAGPVGVLYLYRPNAVPDHVWVMRRFLASVTLLAVLGAALTLRRLAARGDRRRWAHIGIVTVFVVASLAWPAALTSRLWRGADQQGFAAAIEDTCEVIGPNAATLLVPSAELLDQSLGQTLRSFCDVPSAVLSRGVDPAAIAPLADAWRAEGRELFLITPDQQSLQKWCPNGDRVAIAETVNRDHMQQTLTRPPVDYSREQLHIEIYATTHC